MSTADLDAVRALVSTELTDDQLQEVVDREEGALRRAIGQLTGERTITYWPSNLPNTIHATLHLPRHAGTLPGVTSGAVAVPDAQLRLVDDGWAIRRPGWAWGPAVVVTWTPDDEDAVVSAIIDLVSLRLTPQGAYQSEQIGSYGYSRRGGGDVARDRRRIIRSLLAPARPQTIRIRGADRSDQVLPLA